MFFVELVLPFFLFGPRRPRLVAAGGIAALQFLIALTGNYGFFNLLTLALCLLAMDDAVWRKWAPEVAAPVSRRTHVASCPGHFSLLRQLSIFLLSLVPLAASFRRPIPVSGSLDAGLSIGRAISDDQRLRAFRSDDQGAQGNHRSGIGRWGDLEVLRFSFQAGRSAPRAAVGWLPICRGWTGRCGLRRWEASNRTRGFSIFLERLLRGFAFRAGLARGKPISRRTAPSRSCP